MQHCKECWVMGVAHYCEMAHWVVVRNYGVQWQQGLCSLGRRMLALLAVDMVEHTLGKGFPDESLNVVGVHYKVVCKVVAIHRTLALGGVGVLLGLEVELVVEEMTLDLDMLLKRTSGVEPWHVDTGTLVGGMGQIMEADSCGVQEVTETEV